jgi:hypothetical protein
MVAHYSSWADPRQLEAIFLDEMRDLQAACVGPWAIAGDFNMIVSAADKSTPVLDRRAMGQFRRSLNELELKESTLIGRRFTWSNERSSLTLVKLDRWFASIDWDDMFPEASLTAMSSSLSDHYPILMSTAVDLVVGKRFHFERFWLSLDGFHEEVQPLWNSAYAGGEPADPLGDDLPLSYGESVAACRGGVSGRSDRFATSCFLPTR